MFGNIASQIIGYYLIALVFIPLGYGHLRIRRWARTLSSAGLGFWLVLGLPLSVVFLFILLASKDVSPIGVLIVVIFVGLLTLPALITFSMSSYPDILSLLRFPPTEMEFLGGLPFHGVHFSAFFGIPLLITLGLIVYSKRYFGAAQSAVLRSARLRQPGQ